MFKKMNHCICIITKKKVLKNLHYVTFNYTIQKKHLKIILLKMLILTIGKNYFLYLNML